MVQYSAVVSSELSLRGDGYAERKDVGCDVPSVRMRVCCRWRVK